MHWSRPTSCEVPCIRRPWLAIDLRQSFDFFTSPTTKLKTLNSPLTNFSKFVLYWTLYCHPFFGSISLEETSHRIGRDYGKIQWPDRLQTVHATKGFQMGIEILFFERVRNRVHVCLEVVHRVSPMPPPSETTIAYAATHHPPNLPAKGKVVLDLLKRLEHKGHSTWKYNPAQHANHLSSSRPSSQHPHFPGRSGKKRNCVVCSTKFKIRQTSMTMIM